MEWGNDKHGDIIDRTTIGTHAICTIFLGNKDYLDGTWAQAFAYMAIVDELLYLPLDILCFLGVDALWRLVGKGCSGDEVDSVFDAS